MAEILFFPNKFVADKKSSIKQALIEEGLSVNDAASIEANLIADYESFVADLMEHFKSGNNLDPPASLSTEQLRTEVQAMVWKIRDETLKVFMINRCRALVRAALRS